MTGVDQSRVAVHNEPKHIVQGANGQRFAFLRVASRRHLHAAVCSEDTFFARPRVDQPVERDEHVSFTEVEVKGGVFRECSELRCNFLVQNSFRDRAIGPKGEISW